MGTAELSPTFANLDIAATCGRPEKYGHGGIKTTFAKLDLYSKMPELSMI